MIAPGAVGTSIRHQSTYLSVHQNAFCFCFPSDCRSVVLCSVVLCVAVPNAAAAKTAKCDMRPKVALPTAPRYRERRKDHQHRILLFSANHQAAMIVRSGPQIRQTYRRRGFVASSEHAQSNQTGGGVLAEISDIVDVCRSA